MAGRRTSPVTATSFPTTGTKTASPCSSGMSERVSPRRRRSYRSISPASFPPRLILMRRSEPMSLTPPARERAELREEDLPFAVDRHPVRPFHPAPEPCDHLVAGPDDVFGRGRHVFGKESGAGTRVENLVPEVDQRFRLVVLKAPGKQVPHVDGRLPVVSRRGAGRFLRRGGGRLLRRFAFRFLFLPFDFFPDFRGEQLLQLRTGFQRLLRFRRKFLSRKEYLLPGLGLLGGDPRRERGHRRGNIVPEGRLRRRRLCEQGPGGHQENHHPYKNRDVLENSEPENRDVPEKSGNRFHPHLPYLTATLQRFAAFRNALSSVAMGNPSRMASSR